MTDLSTKYLGLTLENPLVVSASPLSLDLDNIRRMETAGAAAVVLHSLFEEQITLESRELDCHLSHGTESFAEALTYFPEMTSYNLGPEGYLEHVRQAKAAVKIPIIGSLNGVSTGTWTNWIHYAQKIEEAGADALELNIYFLPTDPSITGTQVEQMYCDLVRAVKNNLKIPLAVKIGPYFSSMTHMAQRLQRAGADALVLFNRFFQPDFDLESMEVIPHLVLSSSQELLLRLHWTAILSPRVKCSLGITGGVHTAQDVLKAMMAGAHVTLLTSALMRNGIDYLKQLQAGLVEWMDEHEYKSIRQMQGSMSQWAVAEPAAFERANYMKVLSSYAGRTGASAGAPESNQ
ncbi:Dihydroorotate dehydrogenase [Verrucomicrobia bacterium]|nr:Dihydroorotate dehydrogenase [Verrucomicrobiota bacterium]